MKEIYNLRKQGKTWKEIQGELKEKISISALSIALTRWCIANGKSKVDGRKGNKRAGRPKKSYELQEKIMLMHEKSGKFGGMNEFGK